ncbi:MAG: arginine deiminase [Treponema sp.]
MPALHVTSEIKPLRKVLLHRPGGELLHVTPDTLEELLFDDIPFLQAAQQEHDAFADILRKNGVEVVYLEDLAAQAISQSPEIRLQFIHQFIAESGVYSKKYQERIFDFLNGITDAKALILKTMEGVKISELSITGGVSLVDFVGLSASPMIINPMPNLYFTRDPFATIGNGISLNRMYSITRCRETIYAEYIFNHHPDFAGKVPKFYDRCDDPRIEGGDIHNLSEKVLAIGISQRTSANAIDTIAKNIFFKGDTQIQTILAFVIPSTRAFMHLDTVFTQIDYDAFTIHPAIIDELRILSITKGKKDGELHITESGLPLEKVLAQYIGVDHVRLIQCAGGEKIAAAREQWNDGANTLCIAPGKIIVYERNHVTNEVLTKQGLTILTMPSAELSRGRGGPRCMSMPLIRDA